MTPDFKIYGSNQNIKDMQYLNQLNFLAIISHELRTPLSAMLGLTDLLNQTKLDKTQKEYTQILTHSVEFLLSIVNDTLDFSKLKTGHFEIINTWFPLHQLIDETLQMTARMVNQKGLKLCVELDQSVKQNVCSDSRRLRQILINLINNAIKYTDEGEVTISAKCRKNAGDKIIFACQIQDTGIGIHPDEFDSLFEPYFQIQNSINHKSEGTGLGLAISAQLVKAMGGKIEVYSDQGSGSTFKFTIRMDTNSETEKLLDPNQPDLQMKVHATTSLGFPKDTKFKLGKINTNKESEVFSETLKQQNNKYKARILLVEDNKINSFITARILNSHGHEVSVVHNGIEALELIINGHFDFDLIFMDCQMPGINGFDVTRRLRRFETRQGLIPVPIIAITASADTKTKQQCLSAGFNDFVTKPLSKKALETIIENWFWPSHFFETIETQDLDCDLWEPYSGCRRDNEQNRDFIEIMNHLFLIDSQKTMARLRSNLKLENIMTMHEDIHRLTGGCRQIGALRMALVCSKLNNAVHDKALESCEHLLQQLEYELLRFKRLSARFKKNGLSQSVNLA